MTEEDKIADMLLTWEEAREGGRVVAAEELCRESPELLDAVLERIRLLENAGWLREPAPAVAEKPRTLADRYSLEKLIGTGGYAQVWRAYDLQLHRHVAVKVPKPSRTLTTSQIEDVLTEARQIARLRHVNIITVHDVVKEGAGFFIVTDLIDGETLADRLRRGPVPPAEAAKLLVEVARVIAYAHGQGVVHRDLKPANVFLDRQGRPHVGDFGLARSTQELLDGSDQRGTLAYSSPEQLDGRPLDGRTDIWSLGVILYEMLAGRTPFADDNPVRLRQAVLAAKFAEPPGVPAPLRAVCRRCLSVRPEDRFAGASDLAATLEAAVARRRSRRWLIPAAVAAAVAVGWTIYYTRPSVQDRTLEPDTPAVVAKSDEVVPPKTEPRREPANEVKGEPANEKPPPRPPVRVLEGHTSAVRSVLVRAGGWIISTDDKTLRVWPPNGEAEVLELPSPPTAFAFGPSGYSIFTGHDDGKVRQWWLGPKTTDERAAAWASWAVMPSHSPLFVHPLIADQPRPLLMRTWDGDGTPVQAATVSPTGKWLAWTTAKSLHVWDLTMNRSAPPQDKPDQPTIALFFVPDPPFKPDELLFVGYNRGKDRQADVSILKIISLKGELTFSFRNRPNFGTTPGMQHITADAKSRLMAITLEAGLLAFGQGEDEKSFHLLAQLGLVLPGTRRSAVHTDAKRVVCYGADGTVCIWEPRTQRQRVISDPHPQPITDVVVSTDGTQAVTGCRDGKVRVWAIPSEK